WRRLTPSFFVSRTSRSRARLSSSASVGNITAFGCTVVSITTRMQGLARNVFQGDLTLEFDAAGAVLGHGFHPWKPGKFRSIPNLQSVHRLGCTPLPGHHCTPFRCVIRLEAIELVTATSLSPNLLPPHASPLAPPGSSS